MAVFTSTEALERAVVRLLGVDGVGPGNVPIPNLCIERLGVARLAAGAATWLARIVVATGRGLDEAAGALATGEIDLASLAPLSRPEVVRAVRPTVDRVLGRLHSVRERRPPWIRDVERVRIGSGTVRIGTGNVREDRALAIAAIEAGARAIEIVRCPDQRERAWIPYGREAPGNGGTCVTQAQLAFMREAIDASSSRVGGFVSLSIVGSGPCLPEFAAIAALERVDALLLEPETCVPGRDLAWTTAFCELAGIALRPSGNALRDGNDGPPGSGFSCDDRVYWNPFA